MAATHRAAPDTSSAFPSASRPEEDSALSWAPLGWEPSLPSTDDSPFGSVLGDPLPGPFMFDASVLDVGHGASQTGASASRKTSATYGVVPGSTRARTTARPSSAYVSASPQQAPRQQAQPQPVRTQAPNAHAQRPPQGMTQGVPQPVRAQAPGAQAPRTQPQVAVPGVPGGRSRSREMVMGPGAAASRSRAASGRSPQAPAQWRGQVQEQRGQSQQAGRRPGSPEIYGYVPGGGRTPVSGAGPADPQLDTQEAAQEAAQQEEEQKSAGWSGWVWVAVGLGIVLLRSCH